MPKFLSAKTYNREGMRQRKRAADGELEAGELSDGAESTFSSKLARNFAGVGFANPVARRFS